MELVFQGVPFCSMKVIDIVVTIQSNYYFYKKMNKVCKLRRRMKWQQNLLYNAARRSLMIKSPSGMQEKKLSDVESA